MISEEYSLEYGTDKIEMHVGAVQANDQALVVDDLIATGGTLCAAVKLLGELNVLPQLSKSIFYHKNYFYDVLVFLKVCIVYKFIMVTVSFSHSSSF